MYVKKKLKNIQKYAIKVLKFKISMSQNKFV